MKKIIYTLLVGVLLFTSCFEDEGNYKYENMNPPHWIINYQQPTNFTARQGRDVTLNAKNFFVWDENAEQREQEVSYEWVLNNKVVAEGLEVKMSAEELMKKAGLNSFTSAFGTFNVVEKSTGIKYMAKILVWFLPKYTEGDWIVLADKNGKTGLSALCKGYTNVEGEETTTFTLVENAYGETNAGEELPGRPISMNWALDRHIGTQGSITVITNQGGYELNAEDLSFSAKIEGEQFLGGTPSSFNLVARADRDASTNYQPATFLVSEDGQLYTRVMSANYLGGKYLTEPYFLDEKGYKITAFGNASYGDGMIPCYDEKNRRIVIATVVSEQKQVNGEYINVSSTKVHALSTAPTSPHQWDPNIPVPPVNAFPEGTKVRYIGMTGLLNLVGSGNGKSCYTIAYDDPAQPNYTIIADFIINTSTMEVSNDVAYKASGFKFNKLDDSACILTSVNTRAGSNATKRAARTIFISSNNQVKYYTRTLSYIGTNQFESFGTFPFKISSKITYMSLSYSWCDSMIIGCENGDVYIYDINVYETPKLLYHGNVGGKVVAARELGERRALNDKFNY